MSYSHDRKIQFLEELVSRLNALPGVKSASAGWPMPMSGSNASISFTVEGHPVAKSDHPSEALGVALPGYFRDDADSADCRTDLQWNGPNDEHAGGDHRPGICEEVFRWSESDRPAHDSGPGR